MRVGVVLEQCLAPVPGGTGRYSAEVAGALARRAAPDDRVRSVVAAHRDVRAARVPGVVGPRRLPLPRRGLVAAWERGLPPHLRGVDVVHAPTPLAPPPGRARLVVTVHDAVPWTHPETLTPRGVRWHRRAVASAFAVADRVVVPTRAVADALAEHLALDAGARSRTVVVGEGVSAALSLPPDAGPRAARLDLPERFLLTVATLEPRKGLDLLLAALAEPGAPRLPLLCAGQPGWGGLDLAAAAARAGLPPDRVRVLGRVPDADLAVLLHRATALVVPSRAEGFGLPVLEGMAAGAPVVVSAVPALVEVAGGAAHVAGPGPAGLAQALSAVVHDTALRAGLVAAGKERAASFSWDAAADALWSLYRELVPTVPRPAGPHGDARRRR